MIGTAGFGFVPGASGLTRMSQLGRVLVGDDVQIGANCAIDRGAAGDTLIGAGTVLDNLVHIAHNVSLGRNCIICAQVGIAGSAVVGDGVMMGGQVGVADHLRVGTRVQIAAKAGVVRDVSPGVDRWRISRDGDQGLAPPDHRAGAPPQAQALRPEQLILLRLDDPRGFHTISSFEKS